ncbi:NACHT, LRR and PYD domains-containing protein 3-like [Podarcis raffonei]|uniref:NACHT, LRR and PYD domains-containing protein 3-like n=1 Tax=Podarcis raffonei TaxID=65483 RepID=UPI0023291D56|nr:NACHT, LRR and PYD domains-containing protein 3-like [Podarcis raffonei]
MEDAGEPLEDALLFALDNLSEENFKRFKNKLCFLKMEGRAKIPRNKLESTDTVDTVWLLLDAYGQDGAWEVAVAVLKAVSLRDSATRLQKWKQNNRRKKYKSCIQENFGGIPECDSLSPGQGVSLPQRYTELLFCRKWDPQQGTHEVADMERKRRELEVHKGDGPEEVTMENLFGPDAQGESTRTIVLLGPAGVGKTTALRKIMLDWASGKFWQQRFEHVFYISCKAVNYGKGPMTVAELVLCSCPPGTLLAEDAFMNQDSILILIDGFDELETSRLPGDVTCSDPHKKQAAVSLVMGLLRRRLLPKCHLIVAMRPMALGALLPCLRSPWFMEVLGFRPAQREEYFQRFFEAKEDAIHAFEIVRRNETLFSLCFLPALCWIFCTAFRRKPEKALLNAIPETATVTEIHLQLLFSFLGCNPKLSNLKGLCSLAKDGVLHKKVSFGQEELKEHCVGCSDSETLSLLRKDVHAAITYSFVHLSFQELFAALFYLLDTEGDSSFRILNEGLGNKKECRGNSFTLVRFLFGLSNAKRMDLLQEAWGCQMSRTRLWQEILRWVDQEATRQSFGRGEQLLELCHCIYETEDPQFAESILRHVHDLDLRDLLFSKLDFAALSFCLTASPSLCSLRLSGYELGPTAIRQLLPGLLKPSEIQLNRCGLLSAAGQDLSSAVAANPCLTGLDLGENPLGDLGVIHLCQGLLDPHCQLQRLRLHCCNLTAGACEPLSEVLASKPSLSELDLGENNLGDEGIRKLCEGLKHPQSRLQRLTLHLCGLTARACEDLASVLESHESLAELGLGGNSLGDEGVRHLCASLAKQHCRLQRLALTMWTLNRITQKKLQAAQAARPQLILTSYYPPGCAAFPVDE